MIFISEIIDVIPNISVITQIEALSWINKDKSKENIVKEFVQASNILTISTSIVNQCIAIRRSKKVKTPDAIIAATSIVHNLILITGDSDFNNIQGLQIINPFCL